MQKANVRVNWLIALLIILITAIMAYVAYDFYFRLPLMPHSLPNAGENPGTATEDNGQGKEDEFRHFNILVLGLDGREDLNDRTDTIMLVSLDGEKKKGRLLSIPRDTRVKIKGSWDKINAAYVYGGVELTKKTITDFLQVEIDRYVIINFEGLIKMVDEVGGIVVDVPVRMYKPLEGIDLQRGPQQHLDGAQVLAYSRFRGTSGGDIDRARRQQEVLRLLAEKVLDTYNPSRLAGLLEIAGQEMRTDLSFKEMVALVRLAGPVLENELETQVLPGKNVLIDEIWYWEARRAEVRSEK